MNSPPISKALLDYLQQCFPDRLPPKTVTPEELGVLIGQQMVIRNLQAQFKVQTKDGELVIPNP